MKGWLLMNRVLALLLILLLLAGCAGGGPGPAPSAQSPSGSSSAPPIRGQGELEESQSSSEDPSVPDSASSAPEAPQSPAASPAPPASASSPASQAQTDPDGPVLTLEGAPVKQGRTAYLYLRNLPQGETPAITVTSSIGFVPTFYPYGEGMVALLPARYLLEKGTYALTIQAGGRTWTYDFVIQDGEFETEPPFTVPITPGTDTSGANEEFLQVTTPIKQMGDPEKYWDGPFTPPLKIPLKVTSSFGYTRTINGSMDRHGGIDFAAAADTPVYAPSNGRVLYAGELKLTGYTICIEHGFGLKTWYYHLNGVTVESGQWVDQGDQIGLVGSTGIYTTGAHLHYAATVNGAFINPWQFHEQDFLALE